MRSSAAYRLAGAARRRQHLAHAGAHGLQQEFGRLLVAQHDEGHARIQVAEALDGGQVGAVVRRAGRTSARRAAPAPPCSCSSAAPAGIDLVRRLAAAQQPAQFGQCFFHRGNDGDFHDRPCWFGGDGGASLALPTPMVKAAACGAGAAGTFLVRLVGGLGGLAIEAGHARRGCSAACGSSTCWRAGPRTLWPNWRSSVGVGAAAAGAPAAAHNRERKRGRCMVYSYRCRCRPASVCAAGAARRLPFFLAGKIRARLGCHIGIGRQGVARRQRLDQVRRDDEHQFGAVGLEIAAAEQGAQHRDSRPGRARP